MKIGNYELIESRDLHKKCTIRAAIELIDGEFGMIITILNDNNRLCGIVTSGDLTKALLNGFSLDDSLELVMNKNPIVIDKKDLNQDGFSLLIDHLEKRVGSGPSGNLFRIPVINNSGNIKGLLTQNMLYPFKKEQKSINNTLLSSNPHILIVGGAGYIGSILTEMIIEKGWRVRVLDNLLYDQDSLSGFREMDGFSFVKGDICNLHTQVESIKDIDCVVFLAEIVGDPSCQYLPQTALKTNHLAVNSMANLCAHTNINRFVYTSSCSVYGASQNPDDLLNEQSGLSPVSHYARMKRLSEQVLFNQLNPLFSPTILRLGTVFGHSYRPRFDLVVNTFAKNAYFDKSLTVYGGDQWRPNVHVKDVARAIIKIIDSPLDIVKKEIFNVGGNSENYTIKSLSELTKSVFQDCNIQLDDNSEDKRNYRIDFSKIRDLLGFESKYSVLDGLEELKEVFELKLITKINDKKYSNIQSFKERELREYQN